MSDRVTMPALGESVTEGTVTRWLKNIGDRVEVDEPLVEVSTDKVDTEIPSPFAGILEHILVQEDETADVGADLALIGDGSGAAGGGAVAEAEAVPAQAPAAAQHGDGTMAAPSTEQPVAPQTSEPEAAPSGGGTSGGGDRHDARSRRVGHRRHRDPVAQAGRRDRRGRRAARGGVHGQGRHRESRARMPVS